MSTQGTDDSSLTNDHFDFMLVNQSIPFVYRHMIKNVLNGLYGEQEYEFNEVLLLKKVAAFFIALATNQEPENEEHLAEVV